MLRRLFLWHPGLKDVRNRTRVGFGRYLCEGCGLVYPSKQMRCDHIKPVVEISGFRDWNTYISRMFDAIPDGIQHLCRECHQNKSNQENGQRRAYRQARKELDNAS